MRFHIESLDDLRLLTDAILATLPESEDADVAVLGESTDDAAIQEMDPLVDGILRQAESAGGEEFDLVLEGEEESRLLDALDQQMERLAEEGELFKVGELQAILRQMGRG